MKKINIKNVDCTIGIDLDFKGKPEGAGKHRTKPHLMGITTPDGIHCNEAEVIICDEEEGSFRIELKTSDKVGEIDVTTNLDFLENIVAGIKKLIGAKEK